MLGIDPQTKILDDAKFALDFLNRSFSLNLPMPDVSLDSKISSRASLEGKNYYASPQIQHLPDITYFTIAGMFVDATSMLQRDQQSGAISISYGDVLSQAIKQKKKGQTAETADWIVAPGAQAWLLSEDIPTSPNQSGIRSLKSPGTAYDDPVLGKDPQVCHMKDYVNVVLDSGGIHINSGIPSKAFYEAAIQIGTDKTLRIWCYVLPTLSKTCSFREMALATTQAAGKIYEEYGLEKMAISKAWESVGIQIGTTYEG
jgi:Zn-dependent metalloprotease